MKTLHLLFLVFGLLIGSAAMAQSGCGMRNTAFSHHEELTYSLHFNWKFIWLTAGTATMTTRLHTTADGQEGYTCHLITRTSPKLDRFFAMRDTLTCTVASDLTPLYYRKAADENHKYYVDQVWYSYHNGRTHLRQHYLSRRGEARDTSHVADECIFDMMSMLVRARSFSVEGMKPGDKILFPMADGRKVEPSTLVYRGKKNFTTDDTHTTYRCLVFSFVEYSKDKEKEVITFYVTDDANHIPVRIDLFLRFGSAKAFLASASGLRSTPTSIVH